MTEEAAEAEDVDTALLSALEDDLGDEGGAPAGDEGGTNAGEEGSGQGLADNAAGDGTDGAADTGAGDGTDGGSGSGSTNDEPIVEEEAAPEANGAAEE